jgi:hypothetical protein
VSLAECECRSTAKKTVTQNTAANAQTTKPGMELGTQNQPARVNSFAFMVHNIASIIFAEHQR